MKLPVLDANGGSLLKIACLMMQKNERALIGPWVRYHADKFGLSNLYVFDNGSDDIDTIKKLKQFEKEGLNVYWQYRLIDDFENKGEIISHKIKDLDENNPYDFYFPMDCDEFIGRFDAPDKVSIEFSSIEDSLLPHIGESRVLYIGSALFNNPVIENEYMLLSKPKKCFFATDTCDYLDVGFHHGRAKSRSGEVFTSISYFHFHNKPHGYFLSSSWQKMKRRVGDLGVENIARYIKARGAGFHLLNRMTMSESEYNAQFAAGLNAPFPVNGRIHFPGFLEHLAKIDSPIDWTVGHVGLVPPMELVRPVSKMSEVYAGWWVERGPSHRKMRGHLDSARVEGSALLLGGWATDSEGKPATQLIVMADHEIIPVRAFKAVSRPDVPNVAAGDSRCGFRMAVDVVDIPPDTREIRLVSHDPRDNSTSIVMSKGNYALPWATLSSGPPNLWSLPPESDRGSRQLLHSWRNDQTHVPDRVRTGLSSEGYLDVIAGGVKYFAQHQAENGAIIDPFKAEEFQYSTPCFAYAAALVARERPENQVLAEAAAKAMDWSCQTLASRQAATAHEDFFPSPIAHALLQLQDLVEPERVSRWRALLASFDPFNIYRHKVGGGGGPGSNWNCKALAGEYLLYKAGIRRRIDFVEHSILQQGRFFNNEFGLYSEGPMVYDAFPRAWLADMVASGYTGPAAEALQEALDRGAITSLFLQSPNGELPCGGRSSHHQWADALQCVIFETAALRAVANEDRHLAGVFKRAARRALRVIQFWQRPSGDLWIVKNRSDPQLRHGYQVYSSHSQYNLLALTALGYAFEHARTTEAIEEKTTPSESGCFVVQLPRPFRKVIANSSGTQAIVALEREGSETPAGLLRVHFGETVPQLGASDGLLKNPGYSLPNGKRANLSIGIGWRTDQADWRGIADLPNENFSCDVGEAECSSGSAVFRVTYEIRGESVSKIEETYTISESLAVVKYNVVGDFEKLAIRVPLMFSDGAIENRIEIGNSQASVKRNDEVIAYCVEDASAKISGDLYPHRNGYAKILTFEIQNLDRISLSMRYSHS